MGNSFVGCKVCGSDYARFLDSEISDDKNSNCVIENYVKDDFLISKYTRSMVSHSCKVLIKEFQEAVLLTSDCEYKVLCKGKHFISDYIPQSNDSDINDFQLKLYYISIKGKEGICWEIAPVVRIFNSRGGMHTQIGAVGKFDIAVCNSQKFLCEVMKSRGDFEQINYLGDGKNYFKHMVECEVKILLSSVLKENKINVFDKESHILDISVALEEKINSILCRYGLKISGFLVEKIIFSSEHLLED